MIGICKIEIEKGKKKKKKGLTEEFLRTNTCRDDAGRLQRSGPTPCTSQRRTIKMTFGNGRNMLESNLYFRIVYFNAYVYLSGYVIQQDGDSRDRLLLIYVSF